MLWRNTWLVAAAIAAFGAAGCTDDYEVDFDVESAPPGEASFRSDEIRIEEGLAVAVIALPIEDDELMDEDTIVDLSVENRSIAKIRRLEKEFPEHRGEEVDDWGFVFTANKVGTTYLHAYLIDDDDDVNEVVLPIVVVEQAY